MSLQQQVMEELKVAMRAKDTVALTSLRAVKSALLLAQTDAGAAGALSGEEEIKLVQKLVKQRRDSAAIFTAQGRADLAAPEIAEAAIIARFLPAQLSDEEVAEIVEATIAKVGAQGMKDMGKVMGIVSKELAGKADGKTISTIVKEKLA